jgi:hypothetical protein
VSVLSAYALRAKPTYTEFKEKEAVKQSIRAHAAIN